jgi:hypothetical protein
MTQFHSGYFVTAMVCAALLTGGCGDDAMTGATTAEPGTTATPSVLATRTLPALTHEDRALPAAVLSDEVIDGGLAGDLDRWRYLGGSERLFRAASGPLTSVVSRTLVFGEDAGAEAYVEYVRAHPDTYVGPVGEEERVQGDGRSGYLLTAAGCGCHRETPLLLYVAARDAQVTWLMINGPKANPGRALALARRAP